MKKCIMLIIPALQNGGAERVMSRLAGGFVEKGCEVHLVEFFRPEAGYTLHPDVVRHSLEDSEAAYKKISLVTRLKDLRNKIIEVRPDVIVPFLNHVCIKTMIAAVGTPYFGRIYSAIRNDLNQLSRMERIAFNCFILLTRKCIVQTDKQKAALFFYNQRKAVTIANPVDIPVEEVVHRGAVHNFVAAGRLIDQKNYHMMIKGFAAASAGKDLYLDIYGVGNQKEDLQKLVDVLNMGSRVKLRGYNSNLVEEYKKSDAFLMTSNFEGMPNALMEAMAVGLPCISTDCPTGPSDLIQNGANGMLIPVDDVEELKNAIIWLTENPSEASYMGTQARERMKTDFDLEIVVSKWMNCLFSA